MVKKILYNIGIYVILWLGFTTLAVFGFGCEPLVAGYLAVSTGVFCLFDTAVMVASDIMERKNETQ